MHDSEPGAAPVTTPPQVGTTPRAVTIVNGDCLVSSTDGQLTKVKLADATTDGAIGALSGEHCGFDRHDVTLPSTVFGRRQSAFLI